MGDVVDEVALEGDDARALFGPEQLNPDEASRLLARGPGRLVVWMGERGAGKTSLSAELYERQRHEAGDVRFAGSWTLLAFEALAHHRRLTGSPLPAARDSLDPDGREILHLALSAGEAPLHLLLADLPGEVFRRLADCQLATSEVPWLRRADKLVLLVDGARLRDAAVRSSNLTRVRQLLERLQSSGLPGPDTRLALLVTKWDLVRADPAALAYWEHREAEILTDLRALDPQAIALHASAVGDAPEDGLAELRAWLLELGPSAAALPSPAVLPSAAVLPSPAVPPSQAVPPPAPWDDPLPLDEPAGELAAPDVAEAFDWPAPRRRWLPWRRRR